MLDREDSQSCEGAGSKNEEVYEVSGTNVNNEQEPEESVKARVERKRKQALLVRQKKAEERLAKKRALAENNSKASMENVSEKDNDDVIPKTTAIPGGRDLVCEECHKLFIDSYLFENFSKLVCDSCRDSQEAHRLITRTEAKETYLLKDCDLDLRPPPLRFISRKSKQKKFGEMKLYLECQVAERAGEVWGSDEGLEEEQKRRETEKEKMRKRKIIKKMTNLKKLTRPGLLISSSSKHKHEYGEETYNEDEDTYTKVCATCEHVMSYEKM